MARCYVTIHIRLGREVCRSDCVLVFLFSFEYWAKYCYLVIGLITHIEKKCQFNCLDLNVAVFGPSCSENCKIKRE